MNRSIHLFYFLFLLTAYCFGQKLAVVQYKGGGDWYSNPTALTNLIAFCNAEIDSQIDAKYETVEIGSEDLFQYPFVHMTGHGNVFFSDEDAQNLKEYLLSGGFIHIDDNYGIKPYLERELKKVFPEQELVELPASHPIFNIAFPFPNGLPKIHEHDGNRPQAFGLFNEDRLVLVFTYESDLGDGWEDPEVHSDPADVREKALKMGANIVKYAFEN